MDQVLATNVFHKLCHIVVLFCLACFLNLAAGLLPCSSAEKSGASLVIEQLSNHGPVTTYVTSGAVKVVFQDINGYLLARAPNWEVVLVNQDTKAMFDSDYDHWLKHVIPRNYFGGEDEEPETFEGLTKGGKTLYAAKPCTWYFLPSKDKRATSEHRAEYFVLESPLAARQGCRILQKWFSVPFVDAIPLAIKWKEKPAAEPARSNDAKAKHAPLTPAAQADTIDSKRISERTMPEDFFAYPKNMKKVSTELQVFRTEKKKDEFEGLLQDLGSDQKKKGTTKPAKN